MASMPRVGRHRAAPLSGPGGRAAAAAGCARRRPLVPPSRPAPPPRPTLLRYRRRPRPSSFSAAASPAAWYSACLLPYDRCVPPPQETATSSYSGDLSSWATSSGSIDVRTGHPGPKRYPPGPVPQGRAFRICPGPKGSTNGDRFRRLVMASLLHAFDGQAALNCMMRACMLHLACTFATKLCDC